MEHSFYVVRVCASSCKTGLVAQRIRHLTTNQGIAGSSPARINIFFFNFYGKIRKNIPPPGGLEPPTFRLTAERASQLRHGGFITVTAASPLELKSQNLLSCFQRTCALMRPQQASPSSVRYGLVVRIPGSHPGGPGSIPGNGNPFWNLTVNSLSVKSFSSVDLFFIPSSQKVDQNCRRGWDSNPRVQSTLD